ncbi:MAG: hypothetical protein AAGB51_14000 [Planctomycetota bacterium]
MIDGSGGTCVSMPALYVAVGRRLGYPMHLVTTRAHVFARWDGPNSQGAHERLNIEATGQGLAVYDDDHYLIWPHEITEQQAAENGWLTNLDSEAELALFLATSGHVFEDTGATTAALATYRLAGRIDPARPMYNGYADQLTARLRGGMAGRGRDRQAHDPLAELRGINELNRRGQVR